jgi:hypothetical protein
MKATVMGWSCNMHRREKKYLPKKMLLAKCMGEKTLASPRRGWQYDVRMAV